MELNRYTKRPLQSHDVLMYIDTSDMSHIGSKTTLNAFLLSAALTANSG